jgi:hypothetical protein
LLIRESPSAQHREGAQEWWRTRPGSNRRLPRWQRGGGVRSNAYLRLLLCKALHATARDCTGDGPRPDPAPLVAGSNPEIGLIEFAADARIALPGISNLAKVGPVPLALAEPSVASQASRQQCLRPRQSSISHVKPSPHGPRASTWFRRELFGTPQYPSRSAPNSDRGRGDLLPRTIS